MATQYTNTKARKNPYLLQQIRGASPEKLILMLYDVGLKSCRAKDSRKASKVFIELISALNFDYNDVALKYFELYRYALDGVNAGKFENAIMVLEGLRDVWETAVLGRVESYN